MLFMVIERFKEGSLGVSERFQSNGRLMPDGVLYHASWIEAAGKRCFQVMEATDLAALSGWIEAWNDLVDFEVIPVETSADFWANRR
jgi:hypothetical protein